jgi:hypothetical protein
MALDKRNKFIVKTQPDGKKCLYIWTPTLAQKESHRTVSYEEALEVQGEIKAAAEARINRFLTPDPEIEEDNQVIEDVVESDDPDVLKAKESLKLAKSNDDLLGEELAKVGKYTSKDQLEQYFLLKYRVELMPGKLADMKQEASVILTRFANENKLYEVKKKG